MNRVGSMFSGYGGLDCAVENVFDAVTVWHAEIEAAPSKVLAARWPGVPNLGDVTAVDWTQVEPVDVICGGSPCQDVSAAGKRAGMRAGTRSGLWASMCDAIAAIRPRFVVWENVRGVLSAEADSAVEPCTGCVGDGDGRPVLRAFGRVLGDLADLGYDCRWCGLRAADIGAPHGRFRVFVVATDTRREHGQRRPHSIPGGAGSEVPSDRPQQCGTPATDTASVGHKRGGRTRDGWAGSAHSGIATSTDADEAGPQGREPAAGRHLPDRSTTPDTERGGRDGWAQESQRDTERGVAAARRSDEPVWGPYTSAITRWERTLGRPAPAPTELAPRGGQRLSPKFVEFMMGLPGGWVTDVDGISRNDQLKILGNGCVPQQAAAALRLLLPVNSCGAVA